MSLTSDMSHEFEVGIAAVEAATAVCRNVQKGLDAEGDAHQKGDKSPVTVADYASQALVCGALGESFEEMAIVGEEDSADLRKAENGEILGKIVEQVNLLMDEGEAVDSEQVMKWIDMGNAEPGESERFWTLDPIDGTKGFLRKEQYAIALAHVLKGQVVMGILACPNLDIMDDEAARPSGTLLMAVKGSGVCMTTLNHSMAEAIEARVSGVSDVSKARFCESVDGGHSDQGQAAAIAKKLGLQGSPIAWIVSVNMLRSREVMRRFI